MLVNDGLAEMKGSRKENIGKLSEKSWMMYDSKMVLRHAL